MTETTETNDTLNDNLTPERQAERDEVLAKARKAKVRGAQLQAQRTGLAR